MASAGRRSTNSLGLHPVQASDCRHRDPPRPPVSHAHCRHARNSRCFGGLNGKDPRQYGLDFELWTRSIVASLIEQKFGIQPGQTAVGELLAKLGLTPQKPLQRAYQRDPEAVERWRRETFPTVAR